MSRATLIDERQDEDETESTAELTESTVETPEEEQSPVAEMPDKYKGKSVEDLIQMHQELERFSGKQSAEVGSSRKEINDLRGIVDNYIQTQLTDNQAPEAQQSDKDEDVDFFVDPKTAVNQAIDNHPKIRRRKPIVSPKSSRLLLLS